MAWAWAWAWAWATHKVCAMNSVLAQAIPRYRRSMNALDYGNFQQPLLLAPLINVMSQ